MDPGAYPYPGHSLSWIGRAIQHDLAIPCYLMRSDTYPHDSPSIFGLQNGSLLDPKIAHFLSLRGHGKELFFAKDEREPRKNKRHFFIAARAAGRISLFF